MIFYDDFGFVISIFNIEVDISSSASDGASDEVHGDEDGHVMMVIKPQLRKEEREKQKSRLIKVKVSNRFLFWHSRHHRWCECV